MSLPAPHESQAPHLVARLPARGRPARLSRAGRIGIGLLLGGWFTGGTGAGACTGWCGGDFDGICECVPCDAALRVQAFNARGDALTDYSLSYTLNGEARGDAVTCFLDTDDPNCGVDGTPCGAPQVCEIGAQVGLYHVFVSAPGYAPREFVERLAQTASSELCCSSCLQARSVNVVLDEVEVP